MSYKTIVVHLSNARRAAALTGFAVRLAVKHGAHLVGLFVFPAFRLSPPISMPYARQVASQIREQIRAEQQAIESAFRDGTAGQPIVCEWRAITTEHTDVAKVVLNHARSADLVIVGQSDPDWDFSSILDCPDELIIKCGRPVIVVPLGWSGKASIDGVTVAWNGSREAARAIFDALPVLKTASYVQVLSIDEGAGHDAEGRLPDTELAASLSRHGVKATIARIAAGDGQAAETVAAKAAEQATDLLVMGAYGHSRLGELVFGGVTRRMLKGMTVPVLFSH